MRLRVHIRSIGRVAYHPATAGFAPTMALRDRFCIVVWTVREAWGPFVAESVCYRVMPVLLVRLDGQDLSGFRVPAWLGEGLWAPPPMGSPIQGDDTPLPGQHWEQGGNSQDLMTRVRHGLLRQHPVIVLRPGTHARERRYALGAVPRTAYCLAVARHPRPRGPSESRLYPRPKAGCAGGRIPPTQDPPQGIGGRAPMRQRQQGAEPRQMGLAASGDGDPSVSPADCREHR